MARRRCPVCAAWAKNMRIIHDEDQKTLRQLGEKPSAEADRPDDGRYFSIRPKTGGLPAGG